MQKEITTILPVNRQSFFGYCNTLKRKIHAIAAFTQNYLTFELSQVMKHKFVTQLLIQQLIQSGDGERFLLQPLPYFTKADILHVFASTSKQQLENLIRSSDKKQPLEQGSLAAKLYKAVCAYGPLPFKERLETDLALFLSETIEHPNANIRAHAAKARRTGLFGYVGPITGIHSANAENRRQSIAATL